jgi:ribosome-binding factor A
MIERRNRVEEEIRKVVAQYIEQESNRDALISVTRVVLSDKMNQGIVYISVLPENKEQAVVYFLTRNGSHVKKYLQKKIPYLRTVFLEYVIDHGEKNRLRMDELSREIKDDLSEE